jgi:hypothetical protein
MTPGISYLSPAMTSLILSSSSTANGIRVSREGASAWIEWDCETCFRCSRQNSMLVTVPRDILRIEYGWSNSFTSFLAQSIRPAVCSCQSHVQMWHSWWLPSHARSRDKRCVSISVANDTHVGRPESLLAPMADYLTMNLLYTMELLRWLPASPADRATRCADCSAVSQFALSASECSH